MNRKGFTLIELLIVVAIIGILAGISIPSYLGYQKRAMRAEASTNLLNLRMLEEQFFAESGAYTATCASTAAIKTALRSFQPGADSELNFAYSITQNVKLDGTAQTPCFKATATGKTGKRVEGESYSIDCNNNKNF